MISVARADGRPGEDLHAAAHGVGVAGMVQVAAGREEHGAALEVELAEVAPVFD